MPESKRKNIEIACPHQRRVIKASYPCGPDGRYLRRAYGTFDLELVRCSQDEGRCAETLCALHRFNRRGTGTWYPDQIRVRRDGKQTGEGPSGGQRNTSNSLDQLC